MIFLKLTIYLRSLKFVPFDNHLHIVGVFNPIKIFVQGPNHICEEFMKLLPDLEMRVFLVLYLLEA